MLTSTNVEIHDVQSETIGGRRCCGKRGNRRMPRHSALRFHMPRPKGSYGVLLLLTRPPNVSFCSHCTLHPTRNDVETRKSAPKAHARCLFRPAGRQHRPCPRRRWRRPALHDPYVSPPSHFEPAILTFLRKLPSDHPLYPRPSRVQTRAVHHPRCCTAHCPARGHHRSIRRPRLRAVRDQRHEFRVLLLYIFSLPPLRNTSSCGRVRKGTNGRAPSSSAPPSKPGAPPRNSQPSNPCSQAPSPAPRPSSSQTPSGSLTPA